MLVLALLLVSSIATPSFAVQSIDSQSSKEYSFFCGYSGSELVTYVRVHNNDKPLIRWNEPFVKDEGWSPKQRCTEVSSRFDTLTKELNANWIRILSTEWVNNHPVICATIAEENLPRVIYTQVAEENSLLAPPGQGTEKQPWYLLAWKLSNPYVIPDELDKDLRASPIQASG
jgi:hypothetical protein